MKVSEQDIIQLKEELQRCERRRDALLARLEPAGTEYLQAVINEWGLSGEIPRYRGTSRAQLIVAAEDYARIPVPVRQFICDQRYLGNVLRGTVFPKLLDDLEAFFDGDYTSALLAGGIGWGKSFWVEMAMAYEIYRISCLRDPAVTFGMRSGSTLAFVNVSVTIGQARKVLFDGLGSLLRQSPYFQEVFPLDQKSKLALKFPRSVSAYPATASPEGVLGEGIYSAAIDEANFMDIVERSKRTVPGDTGIYDQAEATYNKLSSRIVSRMNQRGQVPGKLYVISSARYPGDFTERLEAKATTPEGKHIFVRRYPSWGTRPPSVYLSGRFKVEVGDLTRRSRVLNGDETDVQQDRVIEVPKDFEARFRADTEASVRDFGGISTLSIKPFIIRREMIVRMFVLGREHGLRHPYLPVDAAGLPLPVTLQHDDPDIERLVPEKLHWVERPKLNPLGRTLTRDGVPVMEKILYPALYHAHIDLSKTKCATGLCVTHMVGTKMCSRVNMVEGNFKETMEEKPIIRVDLALEIKAPPQGEVDIPRVRAVLYQLSMLGMQFGSITFDTYGSQESVKTLKEKGYPADEFSLERIKEGYEALKDAIYDERVWCYEHPLLQRELGQLEDTGKKIEKPSFPAASKDVADALAGAVWGCEEGWRRGEMIGGLFQIGDVVRPGDPKPNPSREEALRKVTEGRPLTDAEEDEILFGDFLEEI